MPICANGLASSYKAAKNLQTLWHLRALSSFTMLGTAEPLQSKWQRKPLLKRRLTGTTKTLLCLAIAKPRVFTFGAVSAAAVVQVVVSIIAIS